MVGNITGAGSYASVIDALLSALDSSDLGKRFGDEVELLRRASTGQNVDAGSQRRALQTLREIAAGASASAGGAAIFQLADQALTALG